MAQNVFTPSFDRSAESAEAALGVSDMLSVRLLTITRLLIVGLAFLLPLFFLPGLWATLGFQKVLLSVAVVASVIAVLSLLMLRRSEVRTTLPLPWLCFLAFTGVSGVSAFLSPNTLAAFRGSVVEMGTVAFIGLLAGVMLIPLVLQRSKKYALFTMQALIASALMLLLYNVIRFFFGPVLPFDSFASVTTSPLGGFNDLALFAGMCILVSLIALLQLPLRWLLQSVLLLVIVLSLIVLAAVNFFIVWLVVGFFGLITLLYVVSRDRLFSDVETVVPEDATPGYFLLGATALVCLVSAAFIITGDSATAQSNRLFGIDYLEVRPSLSATTDIAQRVYDEQPLLGLGPNQFATAWREHKDPSINETLFWSTDFLSGSGYVSTIAVTTGLLGLAALLLFHVVYVWFGIRMLLRNTHPDRFWFFIGTTSFLGATFLWVMTYVYVPGHTILLLAAFLTGLSFVASAALAPDTIKSFALVTSRQRGFGLMAIAILLISGSVGALLSLGQQYSAHAGFNQAQQAAASVESIDQAALVAYQQYPDAVFLGVRTRVALNAMNQFMAATELSEAEQQQFLDVSRLGVAFADQAVAAAPENPEYRVLQAVIFNNLAIAGVPDALARATSSLAAAAELDPRNPAYSLVEAQLAVRRGDGAAARAALEQALEQKRNFTEALFLLAQLDIAEGETEAAIESTRSLITLEPNNPTRYYQLGILETAAENLQNAVAAYSAALELDPNYANARYFRALLIAQAGDFETALSEMRVIQETNPDNSQLQAVIDQLTTGVVTSGAIPEGVETPVAEPTPGTDEATVTSQLVPDSDLLTPLNIVPAELTDAPAPAQQAEEVGTAATSSGDLPE